MQPKFRRGAARKEKAVKQQLANMTIIELVRTAHSYATSIQQIETYSVIVTELAARLEALNLAHIGGMNSLRSATSTIEQLAAENAELKELIEQHAASFAVCPNCSHEEPSESDDIVTLYRSLETPATDAFLREQMAKGVEMFADSERSLVAKHRNTIDTSSVEFSAGRAETFAAQLRTGEAV